MSNERKRVINEVTGLLGLLRPLEKPWLDAEDSDGKMTYKIKHRCKFKPDGSENQPVLELSFQDRKEPFDSTLLALKDNTKSGAPVVEIFEVTRKDIDDAEKMRKNSPHRTKFRLRLNDATRGYFKDRPFLQSAR